HSTEGAISKPGAIVVVAVGPHDAELPIAEPRGLLPQSAPAFTVESDPAGGDVRHDPGIWLKQLGQVPFGIWAALAGDGLGERLKQLQTSSGVAHAVVQHGRHAEFLLVAAAQDALADDVLVIRSDERDVEPTGDGGQA